MADHSQWGKKEVDQLLHDLKDKGDYDTRREIILKIKEQDKELVAHEAFMVNTSIMFITALFGYIARKATSRMLDKYFSDL